MNSRFGFLAILATWSIVAAPAWAASEDRQEGAAEIFHCPFDQVWDVNYDAWPDRWVRQTGPGYPHYVVIEIRDVDDGSAGRSLIFDLDGGAAAISSPPVRVLPRFSYVVEARMRAENIEHTEVFVAIDFLDAQANVMETFRSKLDSATEDWTTVNIGPISLHHDEIDRAVLRLDVIPDSQGDLDGRVWVDDIWLGRLPRMSVRTNSPFNVYTKKDEVVVTCELSGIRERDPEIRFQLLSASSDELKSDSENLDGRLIIEESRKASDIGSGRARSSG